MFFWIIILAFIIGHILYLRNKNNKQKESFRVPNIEFTEKQTNDYVPVDKRKAECPYCNRKLEKTPEKKMECPYCGKFMFIRTKTDGSRVVVTDQEAEKIEEDWSIVNGTHDHFIKEKNRLEKERSILRKRFGKDPSENDIKWSILNKKIVSSRNLNDYFSIKVDMARLLKREKKYEQALKVNCELCYLDMEEYGSEFLAPGNVKEVGIISRKLKLSNDKLKDVFIERVSILKKSLKTKVDPEDAWKILEKNL